ncbi:unnamed protein product, partial [Polarella glacialis]
LCWGYYPLLGYDADLNMSHVLATEDQYPIDAGVLLMLGPFSMDFECSLRFECTITISGIGLASTNKIYLIESALGRCGMTGVPVLDAEWSTITNPAAVIQDSEGLYNTYKLGTALGKSGASHRICWAHNPPEEEDDGTPLSDPASHFSVEIDPDFLWIRFTAIVDCVLGRICTITVYGSGIGPESQILLVTNTGSCGDASAAAVTVVGLNNPQQVIDPGVESSSVGIYVLGTTTSAVPPYGFHICWGPNPSNSSAVNFPLEVFYPMQHEPTTFFADRVGAISLLHLDSESGGRHRALALYADTTKLPATTKALGGFYDARLDYDCCAMAGYAAGTILRVQGDQALPSSGYVFHDRPSDGLSAVALSVRQPRLQGLEACGTSCGDDFGSNHTDYVLAAGFRDLSDPNKSPGTVILLKARPIGPQWAPTWQARRTSQYFKHNPPAGLADYVVEAQRCATPDPLAACAFANRQKTQSLKVVALSSTRLVAAFVDSETEQGVAVFISVFHHLPDHWELNIGVKQVFNTGPTSNVDVAALSESVAIVAFADTASRTVEARVLQLSGTGTDDVTFGASVEIGEGNLTQDSSTEANATDTNSSNSTWKYTATHRRLSVCGVTSTKALVAYGPIHARGEVVLVVVSGVVATKGPVLALQSTNVDDVTVVLLGSSTKALALWRDEAVAKAQEVDVYDDYNGASYALGPGSLVTMTYFRTEGLVALGLNQTGVLAAYRAMDGTERGVVQLLSATFNAD